MQEPPPPPPITPPEQAPPASNKNARWLLIAVGVLIVIVGGVLWSLFSSSDKQDFAPIQSTHTLSFPSPSSHHRKPSAQESVAVVVRAPAKTCWQGYVLSKLVRACGSKRYTFEYAFGTLYAANIRKTAADDAPLELELLIRGKLSDTDSTSKPLGLVSVSGQTLSAPSQSASP